MLRKSFKLSVAQAALCCGGMTAMASPALAQEITPRSGDIQAFGTSLYGGGDINPFLGDINPFLGDINPFLGDINPFLGDINPFLGDINPFFGDINPFFGDISPFWNDINPFWSDTSALNGDINPFWGEHSGLTGDINPFWGDIDPFKDGDPINHAYGMAGYWGETGKAIGDLYQQWSGASTAADLGGVAQSFRDLLASAEAAWGGAVATSTGTDFWTGFANPFLDKWGIDLNDPSTFDHFTDPDRSAFFLSWYDALMAHSGMDVPDHWMPAINWSPILTQDQGSGRDSVIGLLDMRIAQTDHNIDYLQTIGGYTVDTNAHGAAVASLIAARHDGEGVMGIAPSATVVAYNPFDASGTTNPEDVRQGISALVGAGASVINMSLGVPGHTFHQSIADVLTHRDLKFFASDTVLVFAAGNEGVTQTDNIRWNGTGFNTENILIVGSVDPTGTISSFSNRPGDACFSSSALIGRTCRTGDRLMDRFLVAPGELLLVSDNNGGTARATGTSFAAPLVTGTIALMHDFWPWLADDAYGTTEIILRSARDLGDPGVDAVYGHGMLDVEAALSPLNFDRLYLQLKDNGNSGWRNVNRNYLANMIVNPGQLDLWEANSAAVTAYEEFDGVWRDFAIPLSSILHGTEWGWGEFYQRHITQKLVKWAEKKTGKKAGFDGDLFLDFASAEGDVQLVGGHGFGTQHLSFINTGASSMDYDADMGGTNPLLGLASGGGFSRLTVQPMNDVFVSFGMTATAFDQRVTDPITGELMGDMALFGSRDAAASYAEIAWNATDRLSIGAGFTGLAEANAILGAQATGALSMEDGARTTAVTLTSRYAFTPTLSLTASATGSRSDNLGTGRALQVTEDGIVSSAFQLTLDKQQVFGENDSFRVSVMQPLHIEQGGLDFTSVQVTDRATGTTGEVTDFWSLAGGARHLAGEVEYSFQLGREGTRVSAFTRYDENASDRFGQFDGATVGGKLTITY